MITDCRRMGLALAALSAFFCLGVLPGSAGAQVSALPLNFSDVAIFATNSVRIDNGAQVTSGHVVVNNASPGPTLSPGVELGLGNNAHTPTGYAIVADSISISNGAVAGGNAFFNTLSNSGTINGTQNTPLALPVFSPLPTFKSAPPGTVDVTVPNGTVQTLAAGNYRDLKVLQNATLRIDQGVTNVRSIAVSNGGKLLFLNLTSGPTEVRVAEQMAIGNNFVLGPVDSDPLKAGKIIFYVASASPMPVAVDTGNGGTLYANVYAPNGTLILDNGTNAVGAFLAKNVDVQNGSQVALESFFTQQAPAITSANATTFTVGQAGSFTVTTTGSPTPSIMESGALPSGVTFVDNGNGTGTLSGTPDPGTGGTYAITFTASNGVPPDAVQNFTLTVNQAPAITSANATTFTVGQFGTFTVTTTGFPAPSITRGGVALPLGVNFVDNGNGTGTLSGTPAAGTGGIYAITFTATNTAGSSPTQNFTLTVNQAPAITSANATTFTVGQLGTFTVTTTGFPTPSITRGGVALPPNVTFVDNGNGTGTLSGTPSAGTGGSYALTFTASNGVPPNAFQNFTLSVVDPPAAVNDGPYVTDANTTFSRATSDPDDLLDNDYRGFPLATITSFGGGSLGGPVTSNAAGATVGFGTGGSLTVQSDGAFSFTPSTGFTGVFTFQYRLTNSAGTSDATVTINVRPKAANDTFGENVVGNVVVDTSAGTVFSILTNDVFNGTPTINTSGTSAQGGSVSVASGGTFVYNPPVGYEGSDSFTYTITDSSGFTSTSATVSLTVSGMIWFVNNNAGSCVSDCDGRETNPFTTLQAFTSVNDGVGNHPANNDNVFVYESAVSYTFSSGTLLRTGQKLIGQDATASLASIAGVTPPSGSSLPAMNTGGNATTIASTVPLAASSTVRGLSISTGIATGLSGGAVAGVNVSEVRVTTSTGTAVNLNGTGGTVSLISVSANGAANGIKLTNTTGTFTVTGDGATADSGGTIQNTVGTPGVASLGGTGAIDLNGTSGTQAFRFMKVLAPTGNGLMLTNVTGTVSMEKSTIDHNSAAIANAFAVRLENHAGSATLTLDGVLVRNKLDGTTAVSVSAQDTASVAFNVQDSNTGDGFESKYTNLFGSGIVVGAGDNAGANGTVTVNVSDTKFVNAAPNGINNLEMTVQQSAVLDFHVINNLFDAVTKASAIAGVINVNATGSGRFGTAGDPATIANNTIQHIGTSALATDLGYIPIRVAPDSSAAVTHRLIISDNTVLDVWRQGILVSARNLATLNLRLEDNTIGAVAQPVARSNRRGVEMETQQSAILNVEVKDNPNIVGAGTSNTNSSLHFRSGVSAPSNTNINATVTGNIISNLNAANTGGRFRAETVANAPGPANICLDLRNNTLDAATKEFNLLNNGVGGSVFNLNQSGNVGTITSTGTIGSVASCPLPSF